MGKSAPPLPVYLVDPLRWARIHGWRPLHPGSRRDGQHTWVTEPKDKATRRYSPGTHTVTVDVGGMVSVRRMTRDGWVQDATVRVGSGRAVVDLLAALGLIPDCYSTPYLRGAEFGSGLRLSPERMRRVAAALKGGPSGA